MDRDTRHRDLIPLTLFRRRGRCGCSTAPRYGALSLHAGLSVPVTAITGRAGRPSVERIDCWPMIVRTRAAVPAETPGPWTGKLAAPAGSSGCHSQAGCRRPPVSYQPGRRQHATFSHTVYISGTSPPLMDISQAANRSILDGARGPWVGRAAATGRRGGGSSDGPPPNRSDARVCPAAQRCSSPTCRCYG